MKNILSLFIGAITMSVRAGMLNMINCPDCGANVSTRAFMCPKCGCSREAIQQHVKAVDALGRLPADEQIRISNSALFGLVGRVNWLREESIVQNVLTNEAAAIASYSLQQKNAAREAAKTIKKILSLGFTMDQIFIMRYDLISDVLGKSVKMPMSY